MDDGLRFQGVIDGHHAARRVCVAQWRPIASAQEFILAFITTAVSHQPSGLQRSYSYSALITTFHMHSEKIWHKKKPRLSRKWDRRGKMISFGSAPGDIARGDNTLRRSNGIRSTSTYDEVLPRRRLSMVSVL
jgi:hypothetical protein